MCVCAWPVPAGVLKALYGHEDRGLRPDGVSLGLQGSRAALARIGAREEGTLRNHMVRPDGSLRHSTYFSVTVEEWPLVEKHLVGLKDAYV